MYYDIIIIGGGASGLCTAINAKTDKNSVLILEHNDRVGKKILSTGNGKCNLTNDFCKVSLFDVNPEGIYPYNTSGDKLFIEKIIGKYDSEYTIDFFKNLGVLTENRNGYIYPRSEQASTILDILRFTCDAKKIHTVTGYTVKSITKISDKAKERFLIDGKYSCHNLVLACGGMAAPKTGSDGSGYKLAASLGHSLIKPYPALCALKCSDKFFRELAGVRNDSRIYLYDGKGKLVTQSFGNLQFTDNGISGIPVFQISSAYGRLIENKDCPSVKIDLLPEIPSEEELAAIIDGDYAGKSENDRLLGILNKKLANVIKKEIDGNGRHAEKTPGSRMAPVIKRFKVNSESLSGFDNAQVTAGGVPTDEINPETMESRITRGLYFVGEIIDVDGICGGYNLQWAWSTAFAAACDLNK